MDIRMWLDGNAAGPALTKAWATDLSDLLVQAAQFASVAEELR